MGGEDLGGAVGVPLCVCLDLVSVTSSPSLPEPLTKWKFPFLLWK